MQPGGNQRPGMRDGHHKRLRAGLRRELLGRRHVRHARTDGGPSGMRRGKDIHRRCRGAAAAGLTVLLAGCATGLDSLPLPAPGQAGARIPLTAVFANALNLPAKAKVKLNGADIGDVESIRAQDFTARVTMRISANVRLRVGATAELRSATPLGDVFVAIRPDPHPAPDAPLLRDGGTIALASTSAAATIEEALSSATLLVNGGAIRRLVSIVNGAGSAGGGGGGGRSRSRPS